MTEQEQIAALKAQVQRLELVCTALKAALWRVRSFVKVLGEFRMAERDVFHDDCEKIISKAIAISDSRQAFDKAVDDAYREMEEAVNW